MSQWDDAFEKGSDDADAIAKEIAVDMRSCGTQTAWGTR